MGPVVGSKRQETKIGELGSLANKIFPHVEVMVFKGAFRLGIKSALEKNRMKNWEEVAKQPPDARRKFFHIALEESVLHLQNIGLTKNEAEKLISALKIKNEKYLTK